MDEVVEEETKAGEDEELGGGGEKGPESKGMGRQEKEKG